MKWHLFLPPGPGAERGRGEVGDSRSSQRPNSPSRAGACPRAALCADPWGVGPALSPLKGGEGFLMGRARSVHALARKRGSEPAGQPLNELSTARTASRSPMSPITRLGKSGRRLGAYVEVALGG